MDTAFLFVGGPKDGDLIAIRNAGDWVAVAELEPVRAYEGDPLEPIASGIKKSYYKPLRLALFGKKVRPVFVYVHESIEDDPGDELARHLLSPLGQELRG